MADSASPETIHRQFIVQSSDAEQRLDKYLAAIENLQLSRSRVQRMIDDGLITVNNAPADKKYIVRSGDVVSITITAPPPSHIEPTDIPLDILFEDEHLAIINKPAGLVTHPGAGNVTGTLVNALVYHFRNLSRLAGSDRPGIVHRLDKHTSGLLVVAKSDSVYVGLQRLIQSRELKRTYQAIVCGHMKEDEGRIEAALTRSIRDRKKMAVTKLSGREAITDYRLLKRFRSYDYLQIQLQTGRTHQIRVHFSHLGHPVFGDHEYGGRQKWVRGMFAPERPLATRLLGIIDRQALHARRLEFTHPVTRGRLAFEAPLPDDMARVIEILEEQGA